MPRAVAEWFGRSDDTAPPPRVKLRIFEAQGGLCACGCGVKLGMAGERIEYDHTVALTNGGENRESNLRAIRDCCHKPKTAADVKLRATVNRKKAKHLGIQQTKVALPCGKKSPWKRKLDGTLVRRGE